MKPQNMPPYLIAAICTQLIREFIKHRMLETTTAEIREQLLVLSMYVPMTRSWDEACRKTDEAYALYEQNQHEIARLQVCTGE
jgi:hypothetical protein